MNKKALVFFPYVLCAALFAAFFIVHSKQAAELDALRMQRDALLSTTARWQETSQQQNTALVSAMDRFKEASANELHQQTILVRRALGSAAPAELPESLTKMLNSLEEQIRVKNKWPKDTAEANAMNTALRDFLRQLPAWEEENVLPRLNALRWGVQSLQVLRANDNAVGQNLEAAEEAFENQLSTQPEGGSADISADLAAHLKVATEKFAEFRRDTAIKEAQKQLANTTTDGFEVWQRLGEWAASKTHGTQVIELQRKLHSKLFEVEASKFSEATRANLKKLEAVAEDALRQAGNLRLLDSVMTQRLRLLEEADAPVSADRSLAHLSASIEAQIKTVSEKQRKEDTARILGYQQWVLHQITNFHADFQKAQEQKKPGTVYGTNTYTDFGMIRDAVVKHLLPISPGYLDPAVSKIYSQAFEEGWSKLDGKEEKHFQTEVAQKDATTPKTTPQNYQEK